MTDETYTMVQTLISRDRHDTIQQWLGSRKIRDCADFWAERLLKLNDAQAELQAEFRQQTRAEVRGTSPKATR